MKYILVKSKSEKDLDVLLKFARQKKMKARVLSAEETEDEWMAQMIKKVEHEKEEYPVEKLLEELRS